MKIVLLDNYDSFTYNLVHLLQQCEQVELNVLRNDKITVDEIEQYDKILLSPGPGLPSEAGIMMDVIKRYAATKSILGICLGHQGIAESFGGKLLNLMRVMHGIATKTNVIVQDEKLFRKMPKTFMAGRYHSWLVDKNTLPDCFQITAVDEQQNIMAIRHKQYDVCGVQFHPESILTEYGKIIIQNWIK